MLGGFQMCQGGFGPHVLVSKSWELQLWDGLLKVRNTHPLANSD